MADEQAILTRFEAADAEGLRELLLSEEAATRETLKAYLGVDAYLGLRRLARQLMTRRASVPHGTVVLIPNVLGTVLTSHRPAHQPEHLWLNLAAARAGGLRRLRLSADGRQDAEADDAIGATGISMSLYGALVLSLAGEWRVEPFAYDWRKDIEQAAADLEPRLLEWSDDGRPLHLVAHGVGALIARTYIMNYPARWQQLSQRGGRLIMLGPANHGFFVAPQLLLGLDPVFRFLDQLDTTAPTGALLAVARSFGGFYQMLPSPLVSSAAYAALYRPEVLGLGQSEQRWLARAASLHQRLVGVVEPERMICILGDNRLTIDGVRDWSQLATPEPARLDDLFQATLAGDGTVPHALSILTTPDARTVPTYYVEAGHNELVGQPKVLAALGELLTNGQTSRLSQRPISGDAAGSPASDRGSAGLAASDGDAAGSPGPSGRPLSEAFQRVTAECEALVERLGAASRSGGGPEPSLEREVRGYLTRHFMTRATPTQAGESLVANQPETITIGLLHGDISQLAALTVDGLPIDALAVGHYAGVRPQSAALALDREISATLLGSAGQAPPRPGDRLLTQLSDRRTFRGELGEIFLLPDPRLAVGSAEGRLIALAGMGLPGRFGAPELSLLARELCWLLGRLGRRHLATVLIGAGRSNLETGLAVEAWLRGIKNALTGLPESQQLRRVTFIERQADKLAGILTTITQSREYYLQRNRLKIDYEGLNEQQIGGIRLQELDRQIDSIKAERSRLVAQLTGQPTIEVVVPVVAADENEPAPTRVTYLNDGEDFWCSILTATASIPERPITGVKETIMALNERVAAAATLLAQHDAGQALGQFLLPSELRDQFHGAAPLVLQLDPTTARIHWEVIAPPRRAGADDDETEAPADREQSFLGISRSCTRQLRTALALPPAPPPPPRRVMRVLVVADPAADSRLPGAEDEGFAVAELFRAFNELPGGSDNRVEIVQLLGPEQATKTDVISELMRRRYDVLHFAGHCFFDVTNPTRSGWIFNLKGKEFLTARELDRLDRIPAFIFSNACESGVTREQPQQRSVELAPSFAQAFFAKGVSNFVATAWPIDDVAARDFALALYADLLGLRPLDDGSYERQPPEPMHVAMRHARLRIVDAQQGIRTWGAYQHYGDPYFQFFDRSPFLEAEPPAPADPA